MQIFRDPKIWLGTLLIALIAVYSYFHLDKTLALYFHALHDNALETFVNRLTILGKSEWYIVPSLLLWLWFKKRGKRLWAKKAQYILYANIIAGVGVWLLKVPFGRMRPRMLFNHGEYGFEGFGIHYAYVSFPSGHAITTFATATAFALLFPRYRWLFICIAIPVAFSRVTVGAHYFSDVLVGSWLGVLVSLWLYQRMFGENDVKVKV